MAVFSALDLDRALSEAETAASQNANQPAVKEDKPVSSLQEEKITSPVKNSEPVETDDVEARRKAHEEAEAKRKAEWEAEQAAKKASLQEQLQRINSMSDDEAMITATKRVGADTEKITRRNMKDCVAEVIQTKCLEDPAFARKTLQPQKSMVHCFQYISRKAWDYVQDELKANGIRPGIGAQGYGCDIPDDLCYQWAEDYFNDPNANEDKEPEKSFVPRPFNDNKKPGTAAKKKSKEPPAKKREKEEKKPQPLEEQLAFDFEALGKVG